SPPTISCLPLLPLSPLFFFSPPPPPNSPLFPYTTLFRSNCSQCHVEAGGGNAQMELEFTTPPAKTRILDVKPVHDSYGSWPAGRSEEHTSELQSLTNLVCRLLLEKKKKEKT